MANTDLTKLPGLNIEQKLLLNRIKATFDISGGAPYDITNAQELIFEGGIAGSEFTVYNANKLYVCFNFVAAYNGGAAAARGEIRFYDEGNVANMYLQNNAITYESVAAAIWYARNNGVLKNIYFSRIVNTTYNYMKFIGYRLTY